MAAGQLIYWAELGLEKGDHNPSTFGGGKKGRGTHNPSGNEDSFSRGELRVEAAFIRQATIYHTSGAL